MLYINGKKIDPDRCELLYGRAFSEQSLREDFDAASGSWHVDAEGWLVGQNRENAGGMLYTKRNFCCDVLMEFDAAAVPPCQNDLNFVFRTEGWDSARGDAGRGYICGLGGWWVNKTGIEKYPGCRPCVMTPLFKLESGRQYHIIAGSITGHCFIFVDGALVIEMFDHAPEDLADCGRVGFGTYASHIRYKNLKVYRAACEADSRSYAADF